jgi:gamma-glutamylcyclotransferase (GGCT)/AIG2-like uncharacterized protein YtfP
MTVDRIFVYGSLRAGQSAHSLIAPYIIEAQPAESTGRLYALPGGYPGLIEDPSGRVAGDLVRVHSIDRAFAVLDEYEGEEFRRAPYHATGSRGRSLDAWCYLLADAELARGCPRIESGDWAAYLSGRR